MRSNDIIEFTNDELGFTRKFKVMIKKINNYNNFKEYLENETLKKTLPGMDTIDEGLKLYYKYYTSEDENKYKIIAIKFKKLIK